MNNSDPQTILNQEISETRLVFTILIAASLFSLCLFCFLIYHDIVKKILGTSAIAFVVFGAFGISKLRDLLFLRRLRNELFAQATAIPRWIKLSYRQGKVVGAIDSGLGIPHGATSVLIEYDMGAGAPPSRTLPSKFAAGFLPALFAARPQWLALIKK